jgi:FkbM family methyltransferase
MNRLLLIIKRAIRYVLEKAGISFIWLGGKIFLSKEEKRILPWNQVQGDETYRVDYDLNENSIVFDLGGYKGDWTSDIYSRYCCYIHIFEPVKIYADNIKKRYAKNLKIAVYNFGLSEESREDSIYINNSSSTIFKKTTHNQKIVLVKFSDFIEDNHIPFIDLIKINIEGGEYDLLDHLIITGYISKIMNLQIQFHDFFYDSEKRMRTIQEKLEKTHRLTYQFPFIWENWKLITIK